LHPGVFHEEELSVTFETLEARSLLS